MKTLIIIALALLLPQLQSSEIMPIDKKLNNFYSKSNLKISFVKEHNIADPITEGGPNKIIREVLDTNQKRVGFIRDIATTTGCDNLCHPLIFSLVFNPEGKFTTLISRETLTKKNHIPLTPEEHNNLILFLLSKQNYKIPEPHTIVDAITSETKKEYSEGVTKDAALSFYRILNYKLQTETALKALL